MSNDNTNSGQDKIKKLFQDQLNKQKERETKKEISESDKRLWLNIIISSMFYIARITFIYLGYFLLCKNLDFKLQFNYLDFFLIAFAITNFIGLIKKNLKD